MKGIWKYSDLLPVIAPKHQQSIGEGNTPLIKSAYIGPKFGLSNLYFKLESLNPTGSYKDRFAALALSDILEKQAGICLATSSGNTGAALAAFAAHADVPCFVAVVDGAPQGKVLQMQVYGATTFIVNEFGLNGKVTEEVFSTLAQVARDRGTSVQISAFKYSPIGMSGVQTIAYEIAEQLPQVHHVFSPSGGGGLTLAVAKGFLVLKEKHKNQLIPKVHCIQPNGNNTIAGPLRKGLNHAVPVEKATTTISGLQVPNIIDGDQTISYLHKVAGTGYTVSDEEVFNLQKLLAQKEGIYCEPAGAVALAGAVKAANKGEVKAEDAIVCLVTGHGFKDGKSAKTITNAQHTSRLKNATNIKDFIKYIEQDYQKNK